MAVQYKAESFLGDALIIRIAVDDITKYGFDMLYRIENKITGKEIARGKTGIVCFNYDTKKVASIPEVLIMLYAINEGLIKRRELNQQLGA